MTGAARTVGHDALVLDRSTDVLFVSALRRSQCKVMTRSPAGEHVEIAVSLDGGGEAPVGTRCYMNLESTVPELRDRLRPRGANAEYIDRVNAYISPPGCGTPLHFDVRTVWIVQLFGRKTWRVAEEPAVLNPPRNCVLPHGQRCVQFNGQQLEAPARLQTFVLSPGDWLRVPRGVWHETITAIGSISASLAAIHGA
jgi:hypothetical protein